MQIQVSTNSSVEGSEQLTSEIESTVSSRLSRFADQITRVEVHLVDENADKSGGGDKRCTIEARVAGQQPVAVSHNAGSLEEAFAGAANKLSSLLNSKMGKLDRRKGNQPMGGPGAS
ncbi:HPF/RaiA family ribosome-associated protein [Pseudarthrobacter sp. NBSH8]|uniref:HPF/RaiA family ribosome-associated protein n=1 Tax=Pseudarthrobacter sp. NBSH8 TaxID=2596911 RepID=UPI001625BEB7|nr:HPF/RaiA family ribosome-associated protein [Pseudarthrobacter sp. NBSH8]QNE14582.1 HPF/RaiA family ribosome-associated protein [Pseudarthrobacter sp. NBSH8]